MNVKEYIASGIIESYVMGLLTEPERKEFESVCVQHREVAEARAAFEQALEEQLLTDSQLPPQQLRQQVFDKIANTGSDTKDQEMQDERAPVRSLGIWKWIAAASVILTVAAVFWALQSRNQYNDLQAKNKELQDQLNQKNEQLSAIQQSPSPKSDFKMASIREGNQAAATIYWDTLSKDVYLMINNMPQPASDKQYQLWALLPAEGAAPIDLGMIELKQERLLYRMKNVQDARAFAITIEPVGGSKSPTSTPMLSTTPVTL